MANRAADWLKQAEHDLEQAQASEAARRFEWACFAAHQAAEKAVKALYLSLGQEAWGHVIAGLLMELPDMVTVPELLKAAGPGARHLLHPDSLSRQPRRRGSL